MNHDTAWYKRTYGEDGPSVKSKERVKKFGEVLTPRWCAEMMIDQCEPDISNPETTFFEPCCGEGAFVCPVLRRKLCASLNTQQKIMSCQNVYAVDIQYDNVQICRENLVNIAVSKGVDGLTARKIFARNIIHGDMLFFPMIIRIYDWKEEKWTTLEEMMGLPGAKAELGNTYRGHA